MVRSRFASLSPRLVVISTTSPSSFTIPRTSTTRPAGRSGSWCSLVKLNLTRWIAPASAATLRRRGLQAGTGDAGRARPHERAFDNRGAAQEGLPGPQAARPPARSSVRAGTDESRAVGRKPPRRHSRGCGVAATPTQAPACSRNLGAVAEGDLPRVVNGSVLAVGGLDDAAGHVVHALLVDELVELVDCGSEGAGEQRGMEPRSAARQAAAGSVARPGSGNQSRQAPGQGWPL